MSSMPDTGSGLRWHRGDSVVPGGPYNAMREGLSTCGAPPPGGAPRVYSVSVPRSAIARDEPPTSIVYAPGVTVQALAAVSQWETAEAGSSTWTWPVWPGFSRTFWKPFSCWGGSAAAVGKQMYTWATSAPARVPVSVTSNATVAVCAAPAVTTRLA